MVTPAADVLSCKEVRATICWDRFALPHDLGLRLQIPLQESGWRRLHACIVNGTGERAGIPKLQKSQWRYKCFEQRKDIKIEKLAGTLETFSSLSGLATDPFAIVGKTYSRTRAALTWQLSFAKAGHTGILA